MNIAKRLVLLVAVPVVVFLVLGEMLDSNLRDIETRGTYVAELQLPSIAVIGKITRKHAELRVDLRDYLSAPAEKQRAGARASFEIAAKDLDALLDQYRDTLVSDEHDRRMLHEFRDM